MPEATQTPSKRLRNLTTATSDGAEAIPPAATLKTGEKRKRGRPRKNPEAPDVQPITPKRGRGRPPRIASEKENASKAVASPRREAEDALARCQATAESASPKRGRGRPRKSLPAASIPDISSPKKGRGRPPKRESVDKAVEAAVPIDTTKDSDTSEAMEPKAEAATESEPKGGNGRSYWLMKAEPESRLEKGVDVKFSIDDLAAAKVPEPWDGVRNAVARNIMREMKKGDYAFFYHSNCKVPGVVGIMEIVQEHSTDESAFDPKHPYYDPTSNRDSPKWSVVHVEFRHKLKNPVTLADLKANSQAGKPLENLMTLKQSRLSVSKVTPDEWRTILEMAGEDPHEPKF
ncbi:Thymocyte nuclear protein 1 [Penicillium maclennaniae]|uniref:Thymocyte nuclear protein 1 n=1 Tax=Penicillium maclennaniae TaxID=1343394 RepID=UPI002541252E|nr:Thymocyte nuclear protein 1 [Penicillium maclennaniae]KAJ5681868.1 Thymocyte nuclear protein 1 [Penicillium maclennaniae]